MIFVHFTPKANVADIKKNGICPGNSAGKVFLFPMLHNQKTLVNQWSKPFYWKSGSARHDKSKAKVVVRLPLDVRVFFSFWPDTGPSKGGGEALISVAALGRLIGQGEIPNPFAIVSQVNDWSPLDLKALRSWAENSWHFYSAYVLRHNSPQKPPDKIKLFELWLKESRQEWRTAFSNQLTGDSLRGWQVVYLGRIPPKWIIKIYNNSNTDKPLRAYQRHPKAHEDLE